MRKAIIINFDKYQALIQKEKQKGLGEEKSIEDKDKNNKSPVSSSPSLDISPSSSPPPPGIPSSSLVSNVTKEDKKSNWADNWISF